MVVGEGRPCTARPYGALKMLTTVRLNIMSRKKHQAPVPQQTSQLILLYRNGQDWVSACRHFESEDTSRNLNFMASYQCHRFRKDLKLMHKHCLPSKEDVLEQVRYTNDHPSFAFPDAPNVEEAQFEETAHRHRQVSVRA